MIRPPADRGPVRSSIARVKSPESSRTPRPSDVLRAGTAGGDRPRSGGSAKCASNPQTNRTWLTRVVLPIYLRPFCYEP